MSISKPLIKPAFVWIAVSLWLFLTIVLIGLYVTVYIPYENCMNLVYRAEHGDANSQSNLAFSYETGNRNSYSFGRIKQDEKKAIYWYTLAIRSGDQRAGDFLAKLYERKNTQASNDVAVHWYTVSAKSGYSDAAKTLSRIYGEGLLGQRVDKKKSAFWKQKEISLKKEYPELNY